MMKTKNEKNVFFFAFSGSQSENNTSIISEDSVSSLDSDLDASKLS